MVGFLVVVLLAVVFGFVVWWEHQRTQRRIAEMSGLAASKGWRYSRHDVFGLPARWGGAPFDQGYARRAEHVLTGEVRGRPMVAFDYEYKEDSTDSKGNRSTTTYRFGVCVVRMPGALPPLTVRPENVLTRIGQALGMDDIELESEDFNRRYRVRCPDPKFASDVLHPRTMELLIRCHPVQFRFHGNDVICWSRGRPSTGDVIVRCEAMAAVVGAVPDFVWKDYGGAVSRPA